MESSTERKVKRERPKLTFTRAFKLSLGEIGKNERLNRPTLEAPIKTNFQNSENAKASQSNQPENKNVENCETHSQSSKASQRNQLQNKNIEYAERRSENSRIHRDKPHKKVDKHNSSYKNYSSIQDNYKESTYESHNHRNQSERKKSPDPEAKDDTQELECEYIEFSEIKHQREAVESADGFEISFRNKPPSKSALDLSVPNTTLPSASSVYNSSWLSSLSSCASPAFSLPPPQALPAGNLSPCTSPVFTVPPPSASSLSPCASPVFSVPPPPASSLSPSTAPIFSIPPPPASSLSPSAAPIFSIPPPPASSLSPSTAPLFSVPPPMPLINNVPRVLPCVLENSNHTDCNNVHTLLSSGTDSFIPPPVLPTTVNNSDSSSTSSERKRNFSNQDLESTGEIMSCPDEDEVYPPIADPDHLEAISNYISSVVKERLVTSSSAIRVVRDLNILFKNYFEGNVIEIYGSYASDLAITTSDINLVVLADISVRKSFMFEVYKVLANELEKYHVHPFEEGLTAHQTKINFSHPETGINCQLTYLGKYKENVFKMGNFLKHISLIDSRVKTLIVVSKIWAEYLSINEVEDGKLHPVGYALLVIHFLQHCENPILPIIDDSFTDKKGEKSLPNTSSVGELWMAFLKYFSTFNWKQNIVTVDTKEIVSKKSKHWENYWMAIEDPFTAKNIAASVVNSDVAEYIKACFKSSYAYFCNPPQTFSPGSSNGDCQNNGESSSCKYEFSFQQCVAEQNDAFCETCEEIDDVCDECKKKIYVQPMASLPNMTESFLIQIKTALMTIYNKYMLSEEEIIERKHFVEKLQNTVCKVYPDAQMNLFGSSTNGFGFKNSDLDICITFKTKKINSAGVLKDIRRLLRRDKNFSHVVAIFSAQIPIIKFLYEPKGWRGDISLDNTLAVHNSELLYTYSLIDERCKILGCALKLLAKKALVAEVTEKALSSYSYLNMVIHFLQQVEPPVLPVLQDNKFREKKKFSLDHIVESYNVWFCKDLDHIKKLFKIENDTPVEQLWLDLLDYYCSFDSNSFITIRQKETQYFNEMKRSARLFNIQDPFIETKNLGCVVSSKKAQETKSVLNRARHLFRTPVKELPSSVKDIEDYFFSTMSLTGRIHKEAHCNLCGKFGHEQKDCKQSCFPVRRPNFSQFQKYNAYRYRTTTMNKKPLTRPLYRKQLSL